MSCWHTSVFTVTIQTLTYCGVQFSHSIHQLTYVLQKSYLSSLLIDSPLVADQRSSLTRASHEAEFDEILNLIDILDSQSEFIRLKVVASNLDNLPKFGPEEINIAAVVGQARVEASVQDILSRVHDLVTNQERLLLIESAIKDMAAAVEQIAANSASHDPDIAPTSRLVVELQGKLETFSSFDCSLTVHI